MCQTSHTLQVLGLHNARAIDEASTAGARRASTRPNRGVAAVRLSPGREGKVRGRRDTREDTNNDTAGEGGAAAHVIAAG